MNDGDMTMQEKWYATLLRRALKHTPDPEEALAAVDIALSIQPFPDETIIDQPEELEEEDIPVDAAFAFDLFDKRAQGILNRAMVAIKKMTAEARRAFQQALDKPTVQEAAQAIFDFIYKYRVQVARLLGTTQLAAVLEGAREVARHLPALPLAELGGVPPPPSLSPIEAAQLVDRLRSLPLLEQQAAIYNLPPQQQGFARAALGTKGPPSNTEGITTFRPAFAPSEGPERVHFLLIDEAARELSEKNLVTRQVFNRLDAATRQKAFTIAGVSAEETLGKVRDVIVENLTKGVDFESFKKEVLGSVDEGTFLSEPHMETVFRANVSSAFSDGKMEVLRHPFVRSGFPYVSYEAIHDDRVRQDHIDLEKHGIDGTNVFRIGDPVFESFRPPWDYNCRCSWIPLTVQHAAELGLKEAKQWLSTGEEPTPPARVAWPAFRPPVGFQRPIDSMPLSLFSDGEPEQHLKPHSLFLESAPVESAPSASGTGSGAFTQPGDFAPEPHHTPSARSDRRRAGKSGRARSRRLPRGLRVPQRWRSGKGEKRGKHKDKGKALAITVPAEAKTEQPASGNVGILADGKVLPDKVGVWRDWDPLKAVLVGVADNDVLPEGYPDWQNPDQNEVDGPPGMSKADFNPEKFAGCVRQLNGLCEVLEKEGVQVFRAPLTSRDVAMMEPVGLTATWPREEFTIIGEHVIQNQTRAAHRNKERAVLEPFFYALKAKMLRPPATTFEMNTDWQGDPRPFLEGGDIYRLGKDVLVTMSYLTTSPTGFRWLADQLEQDGLRVWPAYLTHDWFHGDYILMLIREGLCLAHRPGFVDGLLPGPLLDWDVIEMTYDEADQIRGNGIGLHENVVMMPSGGKRIVRALEKKGVSVIEVPFDDVTYWQGGIDCATSELWRDGKSPI